jgi:ABC-type transport system involved in multi-copper enzyme maturation permease subunit
MIWLAWRQFRTASAAVFAVVAGLAALLALTGPGLAAEYAAGVAACAGQGGSCLSQFANVFRNDWQTVSLLVTLVGFVLPPLIGLFWGAPLIARELEAGTHRLVWNQSITRTRWLAVKLGLVGLAAMVAAGLGSLAVTWWSATMDVAAIEDFPRIGPVLFGARGIVPVAYAAFAVVLGVTVGMLVRRTLPAMALTLAAFLAVAAGMALLVRPNVIPPVQATVVISESNLDSLMLDRDGSPIRVEVNAGEAGAWPLSSHTVDAAGNRVDEIPLPATSAAACAPGQAGPEACLAEVARLGYRQQVSYQPANRFWPLQWTESGIYLALAAGLAGFCFWHIRRRLS